VQFKSALGSVRNCTTPVDFSQKAKKSGWFGLDFLVCGGINFGTARTFFKIGLPRLAHCGQSSFGLTALTIRNCKLNCFANGNFRDPRKDRGLDHLGIALSCSGADMQDWQVECQSLSLL
jgi:hypothetical protein